MRVSEAMADIGRALVDIDVGCGRGNKTSVRSVGRRNQRKQLLGDGVAVSLHLRSLSVGQYGGGKRHGLPLPETFITQVEEGRVFLDVTAAIAAELVALEGRLRIRRQRACL